MANTVIGTTSSGLDSLGGFYVNGTQVIDSSGVVLAPLDVTAAGVTTGIALALDDNTGLTSGKIIKVASSATAMTSAGRLFLSDHTGATSTSGVLNEFKSAANDETVIAKITASDVLATGNCLAISAVAMTTGKGIAMTNLDALTSGIGIHVASAATAITGAGRLFYSNHTGATGTSATLNEFASAANDETIVCQITGSAALAGGKLLALSAVALTTGTVLDISDNTAATTGTIVNIASNSADTGTRSVVKITQDHASASGATALTVQQDSGVKPAIAITGAAVVGIDFTALTSTDVLWDCTAGTGCTAAPQTNAPVGFLNIKVGGVAQWIPYYNAT